MIKVGDKVRTRKPLVPEASHMIITNSFDFVVTSIENGLLYNREEKIYAVNPLKVKLLKAAEFEDEIIVNSKESEETVISPSHYQVFPEFNLEVRDINKRILDNIEASDFDMNLFEAGWYQQAMQYFFRFYAKNGINDLEKGINSLQIMIDNHKERHKDYHEIHNRLL